MYEQLNTLYNVYCIKLGQIFKEGPKPVYNHKISPDTDSWKSGSVQSGPLCDQQTRHGLCVVAKVSEGEWSQYTSEA